MYKHFGHLDGASEDSVGNIGELLQLQFQDIYTKVSIIKINGTH
jgi:hypothetical protein